MAFTQTMDTIDRFYQKHIERSATVPGNYYFEGPPTRPRSNMTQKVSEVAGRSKLFSALRAYGASNMHREGMSFIKTSLGSRIPAAIRSSSMSRPGRSALAIGTATIGPAFYVMSAYQGYQQGGIGGAVKSVAEFAAIDYTIGAAIGAIKGTAIGAALKTGALATGMIGGGALGIYSATGGSMTDFAAPWVNEYSKKHSALEMGTPFVDNYGSAATMRQRSLHAIQNSKLNGRSALGNEARLTYR